MSTVWEETRISLYFSALCFFWSFWDFLFGEPSLKSDQAPALGTRRHATSGGSLQEASRVTDWWIISPWKTKVMNQLALSEPSARLKPVTGDPKLKAVRGMCYLCRRLSSIASQVENQIREPGGLALAGFQDVAPRWHSAPRSDYTKLPPTAFR